MPALVEILEVERSAVEPDLFWGANLDLPVAGERRGDFAVVVAGWVSHRDRDELDVEVACEGRVLLALKANLDRPDVATFFAERPVNAACGFAGVVRTIELPRDFELTVDIASRERTTRLATVSGRRSALISPVDENPRSATVTTLGRTGSTLLMLRLAQHPSLLVHPPFPYETRVASYWTAVLDGLASPTSYLQALAPVDARRYWWVGHRAFDIETYLDQDIGAQCLGGSAVQATARFARAQTLSFYEASALLQGKTAGAIRYFVEKRLPNPVLHRLGCELFPQRRDLYLVRDFRDMMASILAFNRKRAHTGFGRHSAESDEQYVAAQGRAVDELLTAWRAAGEGGLLVRYEDLVREPLPTLERILRFLDIDASQPTIANMLERAEGVAEEGQLAHRTAASASDSIGRWRRDLSAPLRALCRAQFRPALDAFGYES